jgi:hypothetical protein
LLYRSRVNLFFLLNIFWNIYFYIYYIWQTLVGILYTELWLNK